MWSLVVLVQASHYSSVEYLGIPSVVCSVFPSTPSLSRVVEANLPPHSLNNLATSLTALGPHSDLPPISHLSPSFSSSLFILPPSTHFEPPFLFCFPICTTLGFHSIWTTILLIVYPLALCRIESAYLRHLSSSSAFRLRATRARA